MNILLAGMASGSLMALIFVTVSMLVLFRAARRGGMPPLVAGFLERASPTTVALGVVLLSYPVWGIVGLLVAVAYGLTARGLPGAGLGSPNQAFTLAVVVLTGLLALPVPFLLRGMARHAFAFLLGFLGVFGWFLPHFAAR